MTHSALRIIRSAPAPRPPDTVVTPPPPPAKVLTPLDHQPEDDLIHSLYLQTEPDVLTMRACPECGGPARCGLHCAVCIDGELLRRKVDVTLCVPRAGSRNSIVNYRREKGRIWR